VTEEAAMPPPDGGDAAALAEAGGLFSWIKRDLSGMDNSAIVELQGELAEGVKSEEHRVELLHHCDTLVREANQALGSNTGADFLRGLPLALGALLLGGPLGMVAGVTYAGARATSRTSGRVDGSIRRFVAAVREVRAKIASAKLRSSRGESAPFMLLSRSPPVVLNEGLGAVVKSLVTGGFEGQIATLRKECADISTPEQQLVVLAKVQSLLIKLIRLRHASSGLERFVHGAADWFERNVERKDATKDIELRTKEGISDLSRLREQVLAKKWAEGTAAAGRQAGLRNRAEDEEREAAAGPAAEF
jgi:hypothetical protein